MNPIPHDPAQDLQVFLILLGGYLLMVFAVFGVGWIKDRIMGVE